MGYDSNHRTSLVGSHLTTKEQKMRRLIGLAALLVTSGAWAQDAYVDFDKETDFTQYKTFKWVQSDEDLSETSPLWHERIRNGITSRMVESGMTEVTGDEDPDVYVTYYASESQTTRVVTDHMGYGYAGGYGSPYRSRYGSWGSPTMTMGTSTSREITYDKGTLLIDIWDGQRKEMVWRGSTTDTISKDTRKMEKRLDKMLDKLIKVWKRDYRRSQK
jgi:hypothetical protein